LSVKRTRLQLTVFEARTGNDLGIIPRTEQLVGFHDLLEIDGAFVDLDPGIA